jgi:parvulin-like peptidyl-prolyl isomerase
MDRRRLLGMKLFVAMIATLSLHGWTSAQQRPSEVPPARPSDAPSASNSTQAVARPGEGGVQQTSLVSKPKMRLALTGAAGLPEVGGQITASIIARVNGQPILVEEVMSAAAGRISEARRTVPEAQWASAQAEILANELQQMIDRELLIQDAGTRVRGKGMEMLKEAANKEFDKTLRKRKEQLGMKSDQELRAEMAKQGLNLDEERRQYERGFVAMEYVRNLVRTKIDAIDRQQMLEYFRQHAKEFDRPERVVWQWLFVDFDNFSKPDPGTQGKFIVDKAAARQYAETVRDQLQRATTKEAFEALVDKYAHTRSKTNRGQGEGQVRGEIRPAEVESVLFTLQPNQIGPIVESAQGYHVIRLVERTPGGKVSFEEACPDIKRRLQSKIGMEEYNRTLKELRAKATIESALAK